MKTLLETDPPNARDYRQFIADLKSRISSAQLTAARAVNRELILLYWDIGRAIVDKQQSHGWGKSVVESVATDLNRLYPEARGFSADNLWRMRQFFLEYGTGTFLEQAVPETASGRLLQDVLAAVPWGHHLEIIKKLTSPAARLYYLRATAQFGWSRNVLLNQIKARAYERAEAENKTHNFTAVLPENFADQAREMLKSTYNLEFLGVQPAMRERQLEERLTLRLQCFILELGYGFCFVGRQHRIAVGSNEYFVDLLFYHRFLRALVVFELKVGPFKPEHAGKMDFYLNVLNDTERAPGDQPSIGIILCAEKDDVEVEYALRGKSNPIGVAAYTLQPTLPGRLKGKLPTAKQLADVVRDELTDSTNKQSSPRR